MGRPKRNMTGRMISPVKYGITALVLCLVAAAVACSPQDDSSPDHTPTSQATESPVATFTSSPPTPTAPPTATATAAPTVQATPTAEAVPTAVATDAATASPTIRVTPTAEAEPTPETTDTPSAAPVTLATPIPQECVELFATITPDPNAPLTIFSDTPIWTVSSFEEAECIVGFPIAIPTNLPEEFTRTDNITVIIMGTEHFQDRYVQHSWNRPGDTLFGFVVSQHSREFGLGGGEPAVINGIAGERSLRPARPPDLPPLLTLLWEEDGYWFTISGFLRDTITEEFLLEVAASLKLSEGEAD